MHEINLRDAKQPAYEKVTEVTLLSSPDPWVPIQSCSGIEHVWTSWVGVRIGSKTTVSGDCWCSADEWLVIGHEETDSWQEYLSFFGQFCENRFLNKWS